MIKVIQIIPCPFEMQAVYYDEITGELFRQHVRVLALVSEDDGDGETSQRIVPYGVTRDGFEEHDSVRNLLGFEDGKEEDWSSEIEQFKKERERKRLKVVGEGGSNLQDGAAH